ncbi:MAG TPA: 4Fe-4S dicluster domain-containing protein [Geobacteraceae bacterium]|nr:4Fe-4S dicluster domain-containing protein [Geobacteraceae bacterium]
MEAAGSSPLGETLKTSSHSAPSLTDIKRCSGCGRCISACPEKLYSLEPVGYRKLSVNLSPEKCTHCSRCIVECPLGLLNDGETIR